MQTLYLTAGENSFRAWQIEKDIQIRGISLSVGYTGAAGGVIIGCYIRRGVRSEGPSDLATDVLANVLTTTSFDTAAGHSSTSNSTYIPMDLTLLQGESITLCIPNISGNPAGTVRGEALIFYEPFRG